MSEHSDPVLASFARRTLKNLEHIEAIDREEALRGVPEEDRSLFPVTQLINSLLGLIVFPKEKYSDFLPDPTLQELLAKGWPKLEILQPNPICTRKRGQKNHRPCSTLKELIRVLRNGVSHFNVDFLTHSNPGFPRGKKKIAGVQVSNKCDCCNEITTTITLTVDQIGDIARRYAKLIIGEYVP